MLENVALPPAGVEFQDVPDTGDVPLVADMSSNILTRPVDVSKVRSIPYTAENAAAVQLNQTPPAELDTALAS